MGTAYNQADGFLLCKLDQASGIPSSASTPAALWGMLSGTDQTRLAGLYLAQIDLYLPTSVNLYEAASSAGAAYPLADGKVITVFGLASAVLASLFVRSTGSAFTTATVMLQTVTIPGGVKPNP